MRHWLNYTFSISLGLWILCCHDTIGQLDQSKPDSLVAFTAQDSLQLNTEVKTDPIDTTSSIPVPLVSALSAYIDYGKIATLWTNFERKGEIGFLLNVKKSWFITGEIGFGVISPRSAYSNADYTSKGVYQRLGFGYQTQINPESNIRIGLRYGISNFEDEGVVKISTGTDPTPIHDDFEEPFARKSLSANWYEVVLGSETRVTERIHIGIFIRLRIMGQYDEQKPIDVYTIPGYGRTFDNSIPALNLFMRYELFNKSQ